MKSVDMLNDKRINAYIQKEYKRKGKCKKCGKCCSFFTSNFRSDWRHTDYFENFGETFHWGRTVLLKVNVKCKNLTKDNKCKIHDSRPLPCRQFPLPSDPTWYAVKDKCGFYFDDYKEKLEMGER